MDVALGHGNIDCEASQEAIHWGNCPELSVQSLNASLLPSSRWVFSIGEAMGPITLWDP